MFGCARKIVAESIFLAVVAVAVSAQSQPVPAAPATVEPPKGFISRMEFGGSANTLGQEFVLDGSAGYQFNRHFALSFGLPIYISRASATATTASSTVSGVGDPSLQLLFRAPNPTLNYTGTITSSVPLGSSTKSLSTGRVGIDWNNRFDHSFGQLTPFLASGLANTIHDTALFRRPFTTLGFNAHFEGGADVDLGHNLSIGASGYDIAPSGQQKVFSKIVDKGRTGNQGKHGAFGSQHETTGTADLTKDHGFSGWIDANPNKVLDFELGFSRSMAYDLNTVSFTVGLNLGQMVHQSSRH
jgi:hypothetical protein